MASPGTGGSPSVQRVQRSLPARGAAGHSLSGERSVGDLGMRQEVSGLLEGFKDMLRSYRSLDRLADKQAFLIAGV